ncbi:MAG: glycogen/starch synthase [Campylobacterota bacterium]|nr:glycogen/starch synthase [Campylobacterota bacterium]
MAILFCTSEMYPYAKSGGLGDVAQSLPEALRKIKKVFTVLPLYKTIDRERFNIVPNGLVFEYVLDGIHHQFDIYVNKKNKYEIFIYNPILCDRDGLYHDDFGDFGDNGLRFGLFAYACLEVMLRMKLNIKAIHINDWQTSLIAPLAKLRYGLTQKVVLTIHNLAYQGIFPKSVMTQLNLDWNEFFKPNILEYHDNVNFLKAGIFCSDYVTTVSPTYAQEIQTSRFGHDLDSVLRVNSYKLQGILNGVSYDVFNPKKDDMIFENYGLQDYKKKNINKKTILKELGFVDLDRPLFVFIGRFTQQKGIDLLIESFNLCKNFEANFIILGSGEDNYNTIFNNISVSYPNIYIKVGYDESFSRKLYAGADFLIMPSLFEPCGLNQMICMKYGTVPIVAKTGGLSDSVVDFTDVNYEALKEYIGIGITYQEHNIFWFMHAIAKALSLYANYPKFEKVSKHNMRVDNSWKHSAQKYVELYES